MKLATRVERVKPSPTLAITAKAAAMRRDGRDVIGFGAGEPDFDTPENIKNAGINAINEGFTKYTAVGGIDELKDAIIKKLHNDNGLTYERAEIVVSCGAKHTLYNIGQALFDAGDEVIVPAPYWVSYPAFVVLADASPVILETKESEGFKITPDQLRAVITDRTKAIYINSPSNPTGAAYTLAELRALADILVDHGIIAISDDIYEKIVYDGRSFCNIANTRADMQARTIVVNGVSKSYAMTGWRIGYAAGPRDVMGAVTKIQSQNTSNPTSISQMAAVEALTGDQGSIDIMVAEYAKRREFIVGYLNGIQGISCLNPEGAFYVFPNVKGLFGTAHGGKTISNSVDLADYLLDEANVAVVPGIAFGNDNHVRLSYATSMANIEKGMERIARAVMNLQR